MKKTILFLTILVVGAAGFGVYTIFRQFHPASNKMAHRPDVIVYASSSFIGPYGPGPWLETEFEKTCHCDIKLIDAGGTEILLQKLLMPNAVVDVVIGLDQVTLKRAALQTKWRRLKAPAREWSVLFKKNYYSTFLPYDWSPMTFIYKEGKGVRPASKLSAFIKALPERSVILQDPNLSSPGLQFVRWRQALPDAFANLKSKVQRFTPDWSAAYGLFQKGQALVTFTYLTSLVYHWDEEKDFSYRVGQFDEGHVTTIEYAGVPEICISCGLGESFVEFLTAPESQKTIMAKNFMLPVIENVTEGTSFAKLPQLHLLPNDNLDAFVDQQQSIVSEFRQSLSVQ
jgi:thiamine transport system substrate-binding protein